MHFTALAAVAALTGSVAGHMFIVEPAPLRYKGNPHANPSTIDYSLSAPLSGMAQYPCKGALADLGTSAGASVATYAPGGSYEMKMDNGGAVHGGGSCQISLSYDKGKTFKVIKSIEGGCPALGASYKFTVPSDAPEGDAVFSWSWNNKIGNREFYQNCASVTIKAGAQKRAEIRPRATPFSSLPDIFLSNLGGEYCTPENIDLIYPNPGPDVDRNTNTPGNAKICATGADVPGGSAGGSTGGNDGTPAASSSAASTPAASTPAATSTSAPAASLPGGVFVTVPAGGASTPAAPSPTTLQTKTSSAAAAPSAPAAGTSAPAQPAPVPTSAAPSAPAVPSPSGTPIGGSGSGLSGACTDEGAWNCIGGSSFQRCASGAWSAVIPMAAGTSCQSGIASTLSTKRDAGALRRRRIGWF